MSKDSNKPVFVLILILFSLVATFVASSSLPPSEKPALTASLEKGEQSFGVPITGYAVQRGATSVIGKRTDTFNFYAYLTKVEPHYELLLQYRKTGDSEWKNYGDVISVENLPEGDRDGNTIIVRTIPDQHGIKEDGKYEFRFLAGPKDLSSGNFEFFTNMIFVRFISRGEAIDTALQKPVVIPASPSPNQVFEVKCTVSTFVDCVDAFADANKCTWRGEVTGDYRDGWEATSAMFRCGGLPVGEHEATCKTRTDTPDKCLPDEQKAKFTVGTSTVSFSGCGDKCDEPPPTPVGLAKVVYCTKPLIVPNENLDSRYKSYSNVVNNPNKEDNRYFVFASASSTTPMELSAQNMKDLNLENLDSDVRISGNRITVSGSGSFVLHANPEKEGILCGIGIGCNEKMLELKTLSANSLSAREDCANLISTTAYSIENLPEYDPNLELYSSILNFNLGLKDLIKELYVDELKTKFNPESLKEVTIEIKAHISPDAGTSLDFVKGNIYASALYDDKSIPKDFAKSLSGKPSYVVFNEIDLWLRGKTSYPTEELIAQLKDPKSGYYNPGLAKYAEDFYLGKEGSFERIFKNVLPDGKVLCMCRNNAVLAAAIARIAGINAWVESGPALWSDPLGVPHAFVSYLDENNKIQRFDGTAASASAIGGSEGAALHTVNPDGSPNIAAREYFAKYYGVYIPRVKVANIGVGVGLPNVEIALKTGDKYLTVEPLYDKYGYPYERLYFYDEGINYRFSVRAPKGKIPLILFDDIYQNTNPKKVKITSLSEARPLVIDSPKEIQLINILDDESNSINNLVKEKPSDLDSLLKEENELVKKIQKFKEGGASISRSQLNKLIKNLETMQEIKNKVDVSKPKAAEVILDTLSDAKNSPLRGQVISLPKSQTQPKLLEQLMFKNEISPKNLGSGALMVSMFGSAILGIKAEEYGRLIDNSNLVLVGQSLNAAGTGGVVLTGGVTISSAVSKTVSNLVAKNPLLRQFIFTPSQFIKGAGIAFAVTSIADVAYCSYIDPKSVSCGCSADPLYGGKTIFELQKSKVDAGEKIKYRVYGVQHCGPSPITAFQPAVAARVYLVSEDPIFGKKYIPIDKSLGGSCTFTNDEWCSGEVEIKADGPADYQISAQVVSVANTAVFGPKPPPYSEVQKLSVTGTKGFGIEENAKWRVV